MRNEKHKGHIFVQPEDMEFSELVFAFRQKETHREKLSLKLKDAKAENERLRAIIKTIASWPEMEEYRQAVNGLLRGDE